MADPKSSKKTFEFRMSKKVAELTQVVHMLFTRNHEKEVEIDALKDSYEYEINLVLKDAKGKIAALEEKVSDTEKRLSKEAAKFHEAIQQAVNAREEEWNKRQSNLEKQLQDEKAECQHLRDLLIRAQKDVEKLRHNSMEDAASMNNALQVKDREIEKLRKSNSSLEKRLKEQNAHEEGMSLEYSMEIERLTKDLIQVQELLEETHRAKETLAAKTKQLEADLKSLRKDFGRKVSEIVSSKNTAISLSQPAANSLSQNDELERLRREVQKYRMELSNRDWNFNRVFTSKQPIVIDPRAGKIGVNQIQAVTPQRTINTPPKTAREKSFSFAIGQAYDTDVLPTRSLSSASSNSRLPYVHQSDQHRRLQRLAKPRPIPKEFLLSKT